MDAEDLISPTPPPDKIFRIAMLVVLAFGAAQIAGLGVFYINKWRTEYVAARPKAEPAAATPAPTVAPAVAQTTPAPAPADVQSASTPSAAALSVAEKLLKEATQLRDKGDTTSALARLQDASQRDPKNANVLAEMAMIYESIQLYDRSNETWKKIQEIGPSSGPLYELAEMKLKTGVTAAPPPAPPPPPGPAWLGLLRSTPERRATTRTAFPMVPVSALQRWRLPTRPIPKRKPT